MCSSDLTLTWMGYVTAEEAVAWRLWLDDLRTQGRVRLDDGRWLATDAPHDAKSQLRGRLEALGPVVSDDPLMLELEALGLPGVIDVTGWGGKLRSYEVRLDHDKLIAHGVTVPQVLSAIGKSDTNVGGQTVKIGRAHV